jgi:hypothetical protein
MPGGAQLIHLAESELDVFVAVHWSVRNYQTQARRNRGGRSRERTSRIAGRPTREDSGARERSALPEDLGNVLS